MKLHRARDIKHGNVESKHSKNNMMCSMANRLDLKSIGSETKNSEFSFAGVLISIYSA